MKLILLSVITALLLSGCQSVEIEQQEEHQARLAHVLAGYEKLETREAEEWQSSRYDVLRKHMVYNLDNITSEMLMSDQKPDFEERDAVFEWANFGLEINKERIQIAKEYLNSDYVERFDSSLFNMIGKRLALYEGNISYGEYLTAIKQLNSQFRSDLSELTSYHTELVEKAQRRRTEQKERWMEVQKRMHERRQEDGKQYGPLRCEDIGDFSHCRF
jgi:uncharacterized protein YceK